MERVDTMREPLAVLSDVHGNARALDAVLAEIERRGIRRIVNLGDCLYGPFDPRPAADRLMGREIPTVSGNEDRILLEADPLSRTVHRPRSRMVRFTRAQLTPRHLAWLASLRPVTVVEGALLCHGTPADDTKYLLSRIVAGRLAPRREEEIDSLLGAAAERVILCGHDHTPRVVERRGQLLVNPGSVGCPAYFDDVPEDHVVENGSPDARFSVVRPTGRFVSVELIAVPYDAPAAAAEARANGFPDWAAWIETGRAR